MHSSRMRTGRSLTICRGVSLPWGASLPGGVLPAEGPPCQGVLTAKGVSLLGGLLARGPPCLGGSPCQGGLLVRGVSLVGGLLARGVSLLGGWGWFSLPGGSPCQGGLLAGGGFSLPETPPVDRITDTSKNITLATTSLRPVKLKFGETSTEEIR